MDTTPIEIKITWYQRVLFYIGWTCVLLGSSFIAGVLVHGMRDLFTIGFNLW